MKEQFEANPGARVSYCDNNDTGLDPLIDTFELAA
jgi:hypothetical protein